MRSLFAAILGLATVSPTVHAQAPDSLSHQGRLTNNLGVPVSDGNYNIVFALYDTMSGGSAVWTETHNGANAVVTKEGIFIVVLGRLVSLSTVVFDKPMKVHRIGMRLTVVDPSQMPGVR